MIYPKIKINELIKDKNTYPSWTSNSVYTLFAKKEESHTEVYYSVKGNRKIRRKFPHIIPLSPRLSYALGLLKGEGANSLGKSNYRRFTLTNSDPRVIRFVMDELDKAKLIEISQLKNGSLHLLHHTSPNEETINFWALQLKLPKYLFKTFEDKTKTSRYGVCHLYMSDVLLRRIVDLLHDKLMINPRF